MESWSDGGIGFAVSAMGLAFLQNEKRHDASSGRAEQDLGNVKCVQGNERIGRDNRPRL